jgi:hypothetical protein
MFRARGRRSVGPSMEASPPTPPAYPVTFAVDYPDRSLNRLTTAFRIFTVIPIAIVLGSITGGSGEWAAGGSHTTTFAVGGTGLLFIPPLLMILFREKYPRWWFDWNLSCCASRTACSMSEQPAVRAEIQRVVDEVNQRFARIEQVKRFAILDHQLTQEAGELTPTMKMKRPVVYERYRALFDSLYGE